MIIINKKNKTKVNYRIRTDEKMALQATALPLCQVDKKSIIKKNAEDKNKRKKMYNLKKPEI